MKDFITIGELKKVCESIEHQFGPDSKVIMQFRDSQGNIALNDYVRAVGCCDDGESFIFSNRGDQEKNEMNCIQGGKTAKQAYDEKELLSWVQSVTPRYSALINETAKADPDLAKLMLIAMDSFMANQFHLKR